MTPEQLNLIKQLAGKMTKPHTHPNCKLCVYPATWILAWQCNHCDGGDTYDICDTHTNTYRNTQITVACTDCQGNVSYLIQRIDGTQPAVENL